MLELLTGEPQLVVVDRRVLELLMGPLAQLIILQESTDADPLTSLEEPYVWDEDELCSRS